MTDAFFHTLNEFDVEMNGGASTGKLVEPVFVEKNAIVLAASEEYAPFAAVTIASIIANASKDHYYDIVILTDSMLQRNRWRIEALAENAQNISVRILDISEIVKGLNFYTWAHFTVNTYYRLLTPDIFRSYIKALYLDSDIVVDHDIAELLQTDLEEYYMAAALDTHVVSYCTRKPPLEQRAYNTKELGMENPEQYFQAGVSLFNIAAIREKFGEGYLIRQAQEHKLRWLDQDLLNMLFYGKIMQLPNRWNVMISNQPENLDEYYLPDNYRREYYEARRTPYIVHYVGRALPCYTITPDLYEYFWKYARLTPFYEILLQRMTIDYVEKLAESLRIQLRRELRRETLREKCKRLFRKCIDRLLPPGRKRRIYVKRLLFWGIKQY